MISRAQGARPGYVFFGSRSPLARPCPRCDAARGQSCWNLRFAEYPKPMKNFHPERKARKEPTR